MICEQSSNLKYLPSQVQGKSRLITITPIHLSIPKFIFFIIISLALAGIPLLVVHFWYPSLKRKVYYTSCSLDQASKFHIVNYDNVSTYPRKQHKMFYFTEQDGYLVYCFWNRQMLYIIEDGTVKAGVFDIQKRIKKINKRQNVEKNSYSNRQVEKLRQTYGYARVNLNLSSIPSLFIQQVTKPLYLFILFSCSLWIYEQYYYYSGVIFVTAVLGIALNIYQVYNNNRKIQQLASNQQKVAVLRQGQVTEIQSSLLVPGDIVFLKAPVKIPFDGIILEGNALVDQCSLTGQPIAARKKSQPLNNLQIAKNSYLYQGTKLIQIGKDQQSFKFTHYYDKQGIPVVVFRTNFSTMRGQIIRVIRYHHQKQNIFQKQAAKFLIFLFCLSILSYVIVMIRIWNYLDEQTRLVKFLDLITITVPPGLPVGTIICILIANKKLQRKDIYCSQSNRVIKGGLINWLFFDKTGTLTQQHMEFQFLILSNGDKFENIIYAKQNKVNFNEIINQNSRLKFALNNMALNHNIVAQQQQYSGDPMETKLFEFGQFQFDNEQNFSNIMSFKSKKRNHKGCSIEKFSFSPQLLRMSVIGQSNLTEDDYYLYIKGSAQEIAKISQKQSIPFNYYSQISHYTSQGYRVLAIASKKIKAKDLQRKRQQLEQGVIIDGLLIFKNRVKAETTNVVKQLLEGDIECSIITGDDPRTASCVAYQSGILDKSKKTLICHYSNSKNELILQQFSYQHSQNHLENLNKLRPRDSMLGIDQLQIRVQMTQNLGKNSSSQTILPDLLSKDSNQHLSQARKKIINSLKDSNTQLCITGTALNQLFPNQRSIVTPQQQVQILKRTTVFARTNPIDKIKIISLYQKLGLKVCMCGDGANDSGALKQADIGLLISVDQPSVSSPFTTKIKNITPIIQLIKQCRASVATNFSLFNIMAIYSLIQYTTTIITQYNFTYPYQFQYLYWDIFCNFLFFITIGFTGSIDRISSDLPRISLFTASNIFQIMFAFVLQLVGQILMIVGLNSFKELNYSPENTYLKFKSLTQKSFSQNSIDSIEGGTLFLFTNIMYISTILTFSVQSPWRKKFYTNPFLMAVLLIVLPYSIVMILEPSSRLEILNVAKLQHMPFLLYIFGIASGIGLLIFILQKKAWEPLSAYLRKKYPLKRWL